MRRAAEHLTPVILELGGKSPCIVEKSADLSLAARRIVFGKFLNCGQTCVAPDYIYCDRAVKEDLVKELKRQIRKQYGEFPLENPNYGKIINEKHFDRLCSLIEEKKTAWGGRSCRETLKIEPTVLNNAAWEDRVMQEEIFGPILPILAYDSLEGALEEINARPHPLALYLFTRSKKAAARVHFLSAGSAAAASTIPSFIWLPAGWGSEASERAAWELITGRPALTPFSPYKKHCG